MTKNNLRQTFVIATRESPLAIWQAEHIKQQLLSKNPELTINLKGMTTQGDKILETSLAKIGGKGLFVKELETALLDKQADIAVHSCKDMPMLLPDGLALCVVLPREEPRDALVLPAGKGSINSLMDLPEGAVVGTSSLRRQCQIRHLRPDIECKNLRGNVNTRLRKLDEGHYDAILLAAAGLNRLGLDERVSLLIGVDEILPAVGQGALAIEYREDDAAVKAIIEEMVNYETAITVTAERAMNQQLNGSCQVPIAGYATLEKDRLVLTGKVGAIETNKVISAEASASLSLFAEPANASEGLQSIAKNKETATQLGKQIAMNLLDQGAASLIEQALSEPVE